MAGGPVAPALTGQPAHRALVVDVAQRATHDGPCGEEEGAADEGEVHREHNLLARHLHLAQRRWRRRRRRCHFGAGCGGQASGVLL